MLSGMRCVLSPRAEVFILVPGSASLPSPSNTKAHRDDPLSSRRGYPLRVVCQRAWSTYGIRRDAGKQHEPPRQELTVGSRRSSHQPSRLRNPRCLRALFRYGDCPPARHVLDCCSNLTLGEDLPGYRRGRRYARSALALEGRATKTGGTQRFAPLRFRMSLGEFVPAGRLVSRRGGVAQR